MSDARLAVSLWAAKAPLERLERELRSLESERAELGDRIAELRRQLDFLATVQSLATGATAGLPRPSKRAAVLRVLSEQPELPMRLIEIRASIVERGWMAADRRAAHALEVAVTAMARRGEIRRVRRGLYCFSADVNEERKAA